ncbi:hypothetical protein DFP72DRAFT_1043398 [Ephemerocybe angulata]|uniref:Uncharacterized protein n=1 Tax=Ephemerocybe angulata TaxID=980116 RepID=A0A8H6MC77_9AGAR|nr:hypothetical protein DFP72DRAFT_1043398 [Tulosesus angulatus]
MSTPMTSTSPTNSPNISYVIPCSLSPRRGSVSSSPPTSPLPSTPPTMATTVGYEPEYITSDDPSQWGVSRLVRFDNECVVIPESEWFAHSDDPNGDGGSTTKGGLKSVFGLNKMKKVVMVNKSYSLPLWPAGGASSSKAEDDVVTESGTEDEGSHHQRKVVRLNFKVPIPKFTPERPTNASRHPHLRSPSVEYPTHSLPNARGRKDTRSRSPPPASPTAPPISPILVHRNISPEASRSPSRTFSTTSSPSLGPQLHETPLLHHPHNALYTNPRVDALYLPSSSPPGAGAASILHHHSASSISQSNSTGSTSSVSSPLPHATAPMDPSIFAILPELVPLRPCCPNCNKPLEEALKQGEEWKEKFTKGARRRRRRSSSAASTTSVASSVICVDGGAPAGGVVATSGAANIPPAMVVHPALTDVPVVSTNRVAVVPVSVRRPALSVSTASTLSSESVEETDEDVDADGETEPETEPEGPESPADEEGEPITCGKLTRAVVDEVEGLKRRSASGSSLSKLVLPSASTNVKAAAGVAVPLPTSSSSSESLPTAKPSSTRAFLDVPQHTRGFHVHERVASGGSMNSVSSSGSNGSGGNGSGNESTGSAGSRGSARSRGSAGSGGSQRVPGRSILKNASPVPSPVGSTFGSSVPSTPDGKFNVRSKRHSYSGTPRSTKEREAMKEMERRRERQESEVVMVNTLMNMNIGSKDKIRRSRNGESPKNGSAPSPLNSPRTIDLGGKKKGLCGDDYFGPCSGKEEDDDEDGLFPLPRASPEGVPMVRTPGMGNTPRASAHTTPRGSNTPTPRGGSPRVSPRPSPRVSPRGSPPSPLAVGPPIKGEVLAVQGEVEGEVIKGSITRHVRTASEPMSLRGHEFPRAPPVKESKSSASVASSPARPRPKPQRKTSNSFSAIGRNLRALKGVGADMVKGLGNMGGMAGGPGY